MLKKNEVRFPLNLQFFAECESNGSGAGEDAGVAAGADNSSAGGAEGGQGTQSFDDMLKNPAYQSEFDKRVAKALETQKAKMSADIETQIANAKTEAEKLAKMNADQKAQYEKEKKEKELADREAKLTERELKATAKETLTSKGLPSSLADVLNYSNAEACNKSIEAVETAFKEAVAAAVDDKLKGSKPMKKAPENVQIFTKEQIAAMTPSEINSNWDAVQASLRNFK